MSGLGTTEVEVSRKREQVRNCTGKRDHHIIRHYKGQE